MALTEARRRAATLDAADPLAHVRERFALPEGLVYLDGNSLGAMPVGVPDAVCDVVRRQWGRHLIASWNAGWWEAPLRVGAQVAQLIGAGDDEVVVADSTSVNLFKVLVAAARLRPERRALVVEPGNFPSDLYIAASVAELLGMSLRRAEPADLAAALAPQDVAAVVLSQVDFRTGEAYDVASVTAAVHDAGAVMVWDLSHSAGVLPLDVDAAGVDFAVGCGYKYLCGGPGAPAYTYAARRHHAALRQPLAGWTGHARPFAMEPDYQPAPGVSALRCGTPAIISLLAMQAALAAFDGVAVTALRAKSLSLTGLFIELADAHLSGHGFEVLTPREARRRGSQVSLRHAEAYGVVQALAARRVVGDFRAPDVVRLGFAPLYLRHVDVVSAVEHILAAVTAAEQRDTRWAVRHAVT